MHSYEWISMKYNNGVLFFVFISQFDVVVLSMIFVFLIIHRALTEMKMLTSWILCPCRIMSEEGGIISDSGYVMLLKHG